jgi:hypothetical protein
MSKSNITITAARKLSLVKDKIYVPSLQKAVSKEEITGEQIKEIIDRSAGNETKYFENTESLEKRIADAKKEGKAALSQIDEMRATYKEITGQDADGGATPSELLSLIADAQKESETEAEAAE